MMEDNESENFNRYTPQHPLPEEIKKLARDDTVCKYCGVSYLIHNEIKVLEDKLKIAEKELATLRGQEAREKLLKQEIDVLKQQKDDLQSAIETNTKLVSSLNSEIERLKADGQLSSESATRYKTKFMDTLRQLSKLSQTVRQQQESLQQMKEYVLSGHGKFMDNVQSALQSISQIKESSQKEMAALESKQQCGEMENLVLTQSNKTLSDTLKKHEEELKRKDSELQSLIHEKNKLEENMLNAMNIQKELKDSSVAVQVLEEDLKASQSRCQTLSSQLDEYKSQLRLKSSEMNDLANKQKQQEQSHEIEMQKVRLELQSNEGELAQVMKQLKSLENLVKEKKKKEYQIALERNSSMNETQELKEKLEQVKADREALKSERELMIEAHQNRIEDLRESFKNKLAEMDQWPQKLQAAVAAEKAHHLAELKKLEENLKHNFVLELQIEKDKYNELLKKCQNQEKDKNSMYVDQMKKIEQKYQQELNDLRRQVTENKRKAEERETELLQEIESLKKIIDSLQNRFASLDSEDVGKVKELKANLSKAQNDLMEAESSVSSLEAKLREVKEEAQFLQGIVQRECEERFELTEALSEARKELLQLKKPSGGYPQKRGSISSSVHSSNHSTPNPPSEDPLLKLRSQMPANNIKLTYSNSQNNNNNNSNVNMSNNSFKNGASSSSSSRMMKETRKNSDIFESRKRIASMLGRPS